MDLPATDDRPHRARGMPWIPGGSFLMGSEDFYPEERPVRRVERAGLPDGRAPVTVAEFRRFVKATGYVTVAERPLDPADYPDADPAQLVPGSLVFRRTRGPVPWTTIARGGPTSPGRAGAARRALPATPTRARGIRSTHVAHEDAAGLRGLGWAGAAHGGGVGVRRPRRARGRRASPGATRSSRTGARWRTRWQGEFPWENLARRLPADVAGRHVPAQRLRALRHDRQRLGVDVRPARSTPRRRAACCGRGAGRRRFPRHVIKGGSHLCAPNYCLRYRPAARQGETIETSTSHIGFRCVVRD